MEQYDRVAPPLLKISRRAAKAGTSGLAGPAARRAGDRALLIGRRLLTRTLYHDDGRYFYKNRLPQELPELAVALLVDESGSMSCADRITKARAASIIVYDFCQCLGDPDPGAGPYRDRHYRSHLQLRRIRGPRRQRPLPTDGHGRPQRQPRRRGPALCRRTAAAPPRGSQTASDHLRRAAPAPPIITAPRPKPTCAASSVR